MTTVVSMSISEPSSVDLIGTKPDSNAVLLVISDHLSWDDAHEHTLLIQGKINSYLQFVESGQIHMVETPQIPADPEVTIRLALKHHPPEAVLPFLRQVTTLLRDAGYTFVWDVG